MALVYKDRVKQTCDAPSGSAAFDFDSSGTTPATYQSFSTAFSTGDTCIYGAEDAAGWEVGVGTWSDTNNALTRTTVLASSNSGSAVSFTGTVTVYVTVNASYFVSNPNWQDTNWADFKLIRPYFQDVAEVVSSPAISSNTLTLDLENGNVFTVSLNANITTLTISNPPASGRAGHFALIFTADGTRRTVTWPSSVKWASGWDPRVTATNNKKDWFNFFTTDAGTTWLGTVIGRAYG